MKKYSNERLCVNCYSDQDQCLANRDGITFEEAAKPLICWLSKNAHPHHSVIVTSTSAQLFEGVKVFNTDKFLID